MTSVTGEVLLVEDDAGDALLVEELLTDAAAGLATVWATTVSDAAGRLSESTRCILLDLGLPDSDGLEGLRRTLDFAGPVPVIVLTGRVDRDLGEAAVAAGAQDYLVKGSVGGDELARCIRYAVERRRGQETTRRLAEAELLAKEKTRLERGLLPRPVIFNSRLRWATKYQPGGGRALLGGDFYDALELPDGTIRMIVGDVTGHGPDEAALGVALRVAWRALVLAGAEPDRVLAELQKVLVLERHAEDLFATVCDVCLSPALESAEVRLAGHPAPLLLGPGGTKQVEPRRRAPLLGLWENAHWPSTTVELGREWVLVVFTDGIVEGLTPTGDRLDIEGLAKLTGDALTSGADLGAMADMVIAGAQAANRGPLPDDVALFLLGTGSRW